MTNLDSILKSRDISLSIKVHLVKAMVFSVVMYECESWTIKKAEHQRIDAFELWCWRRLLRVPWTARRSNQSIPKGDQSWMFIGRTDVEAETPVLWPPDEKSWLIEKTWCWERLRAGGEGDNRGWDSWIASPTWWTWIWVDSRNWWWTQAWCAAVHGVTKFRHTWVTELNWTEFTCAFLRVCFWETIIEDIWIPIKCVKHNLYYYWKYSQL